MSGGRTIARGGSRADARGLSRDAAAFDPTATAPDVVLLDVGLVDDDSLRVASALHERFPAANIVMMDLIPMDEDIMQYVNAGCWASY